MAARKIYLHRITLATDKSERSRLYGSDSQALVQLLEKYSPGQIIDEVLQQVETPA